MMQSEWKQTPLGELLQQVSREERVTPDKEYRILGEKWYALGLYVKLVKGGAEIRAKHLYVVKEGDFVYNRLFGWKGSFAIVPRELDGCYVSNEYLAFRIDEKKILPSYLRWYFTRREVWNEALSLSKGVSSISRNRLKVGKFLSIRIPLPSLEEQGHIVAKIEDLTRIIEEVRAVKFEIGKELSELMFSVTERVFSVELATKEIKRVFEICTKPQYGYTDSAKYERVGPKFLRITDIQNGRVVWESVPYSLCPEKEKYLLQSDDILFARSGATTGKSYLVESPPEAIFASYLIRIRPKKGVLPKYLYWFFQSPRYWSQVMEKTKGSAQPNMNGSKLSNIEVPLPSSEEEQRHIVTYLEFLQEKTDGVNDLWTEIEEEIKELIPNILNRAFRGELASR